MDASVIVAQSPNIQKLLTHNSPPLEYEAAEAHNMLKAEQNLLLNLKSQMGHLEAALESLREMEGRMELNVSNFRSIIHPVRRFPTEILEEVFIWSRDMHRTDNPLTLHQIDHAGHGTPWVLT
jgi:hypothetical protein